MCQFSIQVRTVRLMQNSSIFEMFSEFFSAVFGAEFDIDPDDFVDATFSAGFRCRFWFIVLDNMKVRHVLYCTFSTSRGYFRQLRSTIMSDIARGKMSIIVHC